MPVQALDDEERTFEGWGSIETVDKQRDLIPVDIVEKLMPIYMERGGHVSDGHTNRHVGKIDKWKIETDPDTGAPGVYVWGHVFKDFTADEVVWGKIKSGEYSGLSFGGRELKGEPICDEQGCYNVMTEGELWEWALVPRGAHPNANITDFNDMAKTDEPDEEDDEELIKEYAKKLQSQGQPLLADDMVKRCKATQRRYVKMLDTSTPTDALAEIQKSLDQLGENMATDVKKQIEEELPAGDVGVEEVDPLQAIMERLDEICARLDVIENPEPAMEEPPLLEEEVLASETGKPVDKQDDRTQHEGDNEPTPPAPTEQEDKELNEGVTTDTVKSLIKSEVTKEVTKAMRNKGYVRRVRKPKVDTRPPLAKTKTQVEQGEPVLAGSENWRDLAKKDWTEVNKEADKVRRGQ